MNLKLRNCIFEVNYDCNLSCSHCKVWTKEFSIKRKNKPYLALNQIYKIQEKLKKTGIRIMTYLGGEPFLRPDLLEIIKHSNSLDLKTCVVTNGSILSLNIFKVKIDILIISIDNPDSSHDSVRNMKGLLEKIKSSIREIRNYKIKNKLNYPKLYMYSTISTFNHNKLIELFNFANKMGFDLIRFQEISVISENIKRVANDVIINNSNDISVNALPISIHSYETDTKYNLYKENKEIIKNDLNEIKIESKRTGLKVNIEKTLLGEKNSSCNFLGKDLIINPFGDIVLCPMLPGYSAGNILSDNIPGQDNLINNKLLFLKQLYNSGKLSSLCSTCCVEKVN